MSIPTQFDLVVTQEHFDKGKQKQCEYCPFAIALKELLPGHMILVGISTFPRHAFALAYKDQMVLPTLIIEGGYEAIYNFDGNGLSAPGTYRVTHG